MKKVFLLTFLLSFTFTVKAQSFLSLDSCRALALANNKDLLISNEKISAAHYQRKAAFTNYLPNFSATGAYMRNQKEFSLLNNDQKAALSGLGTNLAGPIQQAATEIATAHPDLAPLISSLSGKLGAVLPALDQAGNSLVDALRTDTRNIYAGAITLTQPLYMGGKIRAYNKITKYAEELAQEQHHGGMQEVIMSTDQAYWQVISLVNKKKLAEGYLKLLQQLDSDVEKMINEGVATKADGLSVRVKVNEAEMTLTKVEDGLSLARMLLCQLCGIDLSSPITLADENMEDIPLLTTDPHFDLSTAYENRPEIRSLELATQIYKQKVNVTRAEHLPSIALMGNYMVTNPSVFNSFENKFKGMWNVGVMVQIPIWHWGEGIYKTRAAKAEARIAQYQLQDAREKIELQVNQAAFKVKEAGKKLVMSSKNSNMLLAFLTLLGVIAIVAVVGFLMLRKGPEIIQGQAEVTEYRVSSKVPGRILEFRVKEGQSVNAGDTLAILEAPDVVAKMEQARATEAAAQAQNAKAIKGAREEQIQAAYEMWQKAQAGVTIAEKSYQRIKNLYEQGVMPAQKLDEVTAQRDASIATEKAAKAQYTMAKNGAEREDKMAAEALVNRAKGAVAEVESYIKETYLIAPAAGEVSEIFPKVGELVGTGAPIMNIAELNDMWVTFNVREDLLKNLTMGSEFEAIIPALDNKKIQLKVYYLKDLGTYAAWKATKTTGQFDLKTFEVKASPVEKVENLRPGMSVIIDK